MSMGKYRRCLPKIPTILDILLPTSCICDFHDRLSCIVKPKKVKAGLLKPKGCLLRWLHGRTTRDRMSSTAFGTTVKECTLREWMVDSIVVFKTYSLLTSRYLARVRPSNADAAWGWSLVKRHWPACLHPHFMRNIAPCPPFGNNHGPEGNIITHPVTASLCEVPNSVDVFQQKGGGNWLLYIDGHIHLKQFCHCGNVVTLDSKCTLGATIMVGGWSRLLCSWNEYPS